MNLFSKLCFVTLGFLLQTGVSFEECGRRFNANSKGSRPKRIIGGNVASINSWPWVVSFVSKEDNTKQYCSGSLISPYWILTTAHCYLGNGYAFRVDHWKYIAGNHFLDEKDPHEQVLEPEEVFIHPKYVHLNDYFPGDYDIALIRLRLPAKVTPQVRTICLPNDSRSDTKENKHFVVGWGNVYDTQTYNRSRVLKELRVDIIPLDVCNGSSSYGGNITQRQFCAGHPDGEQDACSGDSGGPLQYLKKDGSWTIKGLVSWGRGCARKHMYGVYTDVKALLPYITRVMQGSTCGVRGHSQNHTRPKRVVGGKEAVMHSWPWIVSLVAKKDNKQKCAGSIVASNWILTAAHCFGGHKFNVSQHDYQVGDHSLNQVEVGEEKVIPEAIYVHPDYIAPTFTNPGDFDVALVKLQYSLEWSDTIAPVCLPRASSVPPLTNAECYVVGWGNVADTYEYKRSRVLKELRVQEVSHEKCNSNVSYAGKIPGNFFCAGFREGGNDTCYGDSGGALQCDAGNGTWNVRGIISWGIGCARPNYFGVYSNVSKMMPFVNAVLSGPDSDIQRILGMTVQDIAEQQRPKSEEVMRLCSTNMFAIMTFARPKLTSIDLVRTLALQPKELTLLKFASPRDIALASDEMVEIFCKSKSIKAIVNILMKSRWKYIAVNNNTLINIARQVNMTTEEIASLLRMTVTSVLLMRHVEAGVLLREIRERKVIEAKVSHRLETFVLDLAKFQPGCELDLLKLQRILRKYPYALVRNMSDNAVKKMISMNHIRVFMEHVQLKNLCLFFGRTCDALRELRLREVIVGLLGLPLETLTESYSYLCNGVSVENTLIEVEIYWNISTVELTIENILTASRLMEDVSFEGCGRRFIANTKSWRPKRIIGGNVASINSWPWVVSFVSKEDNTKQYCSGSLISPYWILTTAHCYLSTSYTFSVDHWKYIAGNHFLDEKDPHEQVLEPEEVFIHPKYVNSNDYFPGDYDIALIRLRLPAKVTPQVRTICLPNDSRSDTEENKHFVVGWGNVYDTQTYNRSRVLKELRVDIIPLDVCNGSSSYGGNITQRQFCAGHPDGEQDACSGDSGGPLQYLKKDGSWTIKGLVSWGRGCARKHMYGVYTDVKALLPYITRVMQDKYDCNLCRENSVDYIQNCDVVCTNTLICPSDECNSNLIQGPCSCEDKKKKERRASKLKLSLILGVSSGCLVAFIVIVLICFISNHHRANRAEKSEKSNRDPESSENIEQKDASNNNVSFLPRSKAVNGKSSSYVALEVCDTEAKCNGNRDSLLHHC